MVRFGGLSQYGLAREQLAHTKLPLGIKPRFKTTKTPNKKKYASRHRRQGYCPISTTVDNNAEGDLGGIESHNRVGREIAIEH